MTQIYGHGWTAAHGSSDIDDFWRRGLSGFHDSLIHDGITRLMFCQSFKNYPPNLLQFRDLCLAVPDEHAMIDAALKPGVSCDEYVQAMRQYIGSWNLNHLTHAELIPRARDAYKHVRAKYYERIAALTNTPQLAITNHESIETKLLR